jgi:hypothetical protein
MTNLVADHLRVNMLVLKIASWVASAVARRVELWDDNLVVPPALAAPLVLPPALAARAAVLAFGDELLDLKLSLYGNDLWRAPGGRDFAAAYLLPRAEAALLQELRRAARARSDGVGSLPGRTSNSTQRAGCCSRAGSAP